MLNAYLTGRARICGLEVKNLSESVVAIRWGYRVVESEREDPHLGRYRTCGIEIRDLSDPAEPVAAVLVDVSPDRQFVSELAALFESAGLSPAHFYDAVTDALP